MGNVGGEQVQKEYFTHKEDTKYPIMLLSIAQWL